MIWPARSSTMPLVAWLSLMSCRSTIVIDDEVSSSITSCVRCGSNRPSIGPAGFPIPGPLGGLIITAPASRQSAHPVCLDIGFDHLADDATGRDLRQDSRG